MIQKTKQNWAIGNIVKVGFLSLKVVDIVSKKDFLPDIYKLKSLDGKVNYEFIPHNGLFRV